MDIWPSAGFQNSPGCPPCKTDSLIPLTREAEAGVCGRPAQAGSRPGPAAESGVRRTVPEGVGKQEFPLADNTELIFSLNQKVLNQQEQ